MGACLSKKKKPLAGTGTKSATTEPAAATAVFEWKKPSGNGVTVSKPKVEAEQEKKENKKVQEKHESVKEHKGQVKKEIFIIKHRKSHDFDASEKRNSKGTAENDDPQSSNGGDIEAAELMRMKTSSCTKEEVDAILIHCGRLSRNSSGKAASFGERGRRFSGSKRSQDFDNCDTISTEKVNATDNDWMDVSEKRHRQSPRSLSADGERRRRRTPSREREEKQRSSSRERRVSRSPVRRSSETTNTPAIANARNNTKPGKMVSVPATVASLVMDKSNNHGSGGGGEFAAAATSIQRITVRRNVGAASPRSQSPARPNGNAGNQQQPSLSRNNSRKAEQSPQRRIPLSEVEPNSLAFPYSTTNNNNSRVQSRPKKEIEVEANQKPNGSRIALEKCVGVNVKTKVQPEEDINKVQSSMSDHVVVKTVVPPSGVDNRKTQTLTRSRSSRLSRDLDLNPEFLLIPPQSYTSLLLEDIQNFHQKNTPPVSLPACVTRACSILEAVADLNSNTSSNFSSRNQHNVPLSTTATATTTTTKDHGNKVLNTKDPIVETELFIYDDVMEPSLHKYVTEVNKGGSDMEDQESSGSNSFTVSSGKQWRGNSSSSSWEPSSTDSKDCWSSRLNKCREEGQNSKESTRCDVDGAKKKLNNKMERGSDMGRGRLGGNNVLHMKPVVTAAASTYR